MNNQFFQTLLTKRGRFLNGENPSPAKLSAINAQTESAFAVIESFLGNGTDYLITSNANRRLLPNVSSAVGTGERIYKPVNRFYSLDLVASKYLGDAGLYSEAYKELNLGATTTLVIDIPQNSIIGLYYTTNDNNNMSVTYNTNVTQVFSPSPSGVFSWAWVTPTSAMAPSFTITCTGGVTLKSLVLYFQTDIPSPIHQINKVANIAYSIPLNNNNYFCVKTPCYWARSGRSGNNGISDYICGSKTCDFCVGNTYDLASESSSGYGTPMCQGAVSATGGISLSYTADTTTSYKTVQSPILTVDIPYSAKFMPFKIYNSLTSGLAAGVQLPSNSLLLYDIMNNSIPVMQNVDFFSASATRGDIVYIKSIVGIQDSLKQYLVLGGSYGLSNMIWDIFGLTKGM